MYNLIQRYALMLDLPRHTDVAKQQDLNNKGQVKAVLLYLLNKSAHLHL